MRLVLLFTYGVSLEMWDQCGLLDREIALYKELAGKGIDVSFVTYGGQKDYEYQPRLSGIRIVPFHASTRRPRNKFAAFLKSFLMPVYLRKVLCEADLIKTNQMLGSWVALLAKAMYRKKIIVRCGYELNACAGASRRRGLYRLGSRALSFLSYRFADRVMLATESMSACVREDFRVDPRKITVQFNYIDTELFRPRGGPENGRMLFVGRLTPVKNLHSLLDAVKMAGVGCDLVGDGELRPEIEKYARDQRIDARLLGSRPNAELPELVSRYSLFILPSFSEWSPKALLEAMSCGRAVIGTNVRGIREVIVDGENGVLCETSASSMAQSIRRLMEDGELRVRLGHNARRHIVAHYDIRAILQKELDVYRSLCG